MQLIRSKLKKKGIVASKDLLLHPTDKPVRVAGIVVIRQRPVTAKGFLFLTLEDETGFSNIVVKPKMTARYRKEVVHSRALMVEGKLEKKDGVVNVIGHQFIPFTINNRDLGPRSRDFR